MNWITDYIDNFDADGSWPVATPPFTVSSSATGFTVWQSPQRVRMTGTVTGGGLFLCSNDMATTDPFISASPNQFIEFTFDGIDTPSGVDQTQFGMVADIYSLSADEATQSQNVLLAINFNPANPNPYNLLVKYQADSDPEIIIYSDSIAVLPGDVFRIEKLFRNGRIVINAYRNGALLVTGSQPNKLSLKTTNHNYWDLTYTETSVNNPFFLEFGPLAFGHADLIYNSVVPVKMQSFFGTVGESPIESEE